MRKARGEVPVLRASRRQSHRFARRPRTGDLIRRRRECLKCGRRFTTYERIDEIPYMVIKKDGRREKFDRQKILQGLLKAAKNAPCRWQAGSDRG